MRVEKKETLDPEVVGFLNKLADFIIKRDLGVIAIMYIESMRPLHRVSSNLITFFEPFLTVLFRGENLQRMRKAMEEDKYMEYLMVRIEDGKLTEDIENDEEI